ncbi:macrophage mannose receptor 1 isoform X2 [Hermetia illucens]|uniref:macrophage mannose receptor 1 isoform X2 n=1 Tax=Hermetia illucens TaxID=343691 RepID=UPI0018CC6D4E|nr:macrophage mannose receptor 1 isoform X2 [Hermetia illucens]
MARVCVIILCISMVIAQRSSSSSSSSLHGRSGFGELKELERQNRITQQIFANYVERRLFPNRRFQPKPPTIDEILPKSTEPTLIKITNSNQRQRRGENEDYPSEDVNHQDDSLLDDFEDKEGDSESLQSVESKQHQYYPDGYTADPAINEIDQDCPNCVDDSQFTNKWTMPLLKLGEKRYYLGIFFKANWFKAAQYCRFHGMHLASISSQEENDRLEKHIRDFGLGHEHFWISGTDLADEGHFFWMANGRPITFTNWNAGEPNNFRYENGEEENCLELWNRDGKGLKWNDSPCSFETYFVCEVQ